MKLNFIFPGKTRESFLATGTAAYLKRLKPLAEAREVVVKGVSLPPSAGPSAKTQARAKEGAAILAHCNPGEVLVVLDVSGRLMSSEELSSWLVEARDRGLNTINWAVGGPWGLDAKLIEKAGLKLSLSPMTFTHEMARMILLEQVYRALTIAAGWPYHK